MKKQIRKLVVAVFLVAILSFSFLISGCSFVDTINDFLGVSNSGGNNGTNQGGGGQDEQEPEGEHVHNLQHVPAKGSTCTSYGNLEYWYCSGCRQYFLEASAAQAVSSNNCFLSTYAEHNYRNGACTVCGRPESGDLNLSFVSGTYGYNSLNSAQKQLYEDIDTAATAFHTSGEALTMSSRGGSTYRTLCKDRSARDEVQKYFTYTEYGLTEAEVSRVYKVYRADHPLYYWLTSSYLISSASGSQTECLVPVVQNEYASEAARTAANTLLASRIQAMLGKADEHDDAYHKVLAYHDAIVHSINYSYSSRNVPEDKNWAHSILGVFLAGSKCGLDTITGAVCEGYAKSFQLLLNLSGIDNVYVTGFGKTGSGGENHAWNLVKLDGKYYWFDLTWDDQPTNPDGVIYKYFCASNANTDFTDSHLANRSAASGSTLQVDVLYPLPSSSELASSDYVGEGTVGTVYNPTNYSYAVCGYNTVRLESCNETGEVSIPETVTLSNRTYQVAVIGNLPNPTTLKAVFTSGIVKVNVPKTVRYIYDISFNVSTLQEIDVDGQNEKYCSDQGVLYTKNKYTLVAYPFARAGETYNLPRATMVIASHAFDCCGRSTRNLKELTVSKLAHYFTNIGVGYVDSAGEYAELVNVGIGVDVAFSSSKLKEHSEIETISSFT